MAPFSIPAPCIIALRLPVFGGPKSIDTNTKVQLLCETQLDIEIFYTLDGTKPQPYAGIVQGSKTFKYTSSFCLPAGKITIRAIAINANIYTMCSSVVTKCYEVLKAESSEDLKHSAKIKQSKNKKTKNLHAALGKGKIQSNEVIGDSTTDKFDSFSVTSGTNCFEEAFIGGSEFETELSEDEDSIEDKSVFLTVESGDDISVNSDDSEESENLKSLDLNGEKMTVVNDRVDFVSENGETYTVPEKVEMEDSNFTLQNNSAASVETQFCCVKCDMTLQHCSSCNRMNAVSSKYCIECGKQLTLVCFFCKNHNPGVATFCQYCGKKLNSTLNTHLESSSKVDHSVMAKPKFKNVCIQKFPALVDKYTQTINERSPVKKNSPKFQMKQLPRHSPGRGYWHQQLDYICNHLKSHAYNHIEFRKEISEPTLCDFKSAHIEKDENNITVTIIFSPLETDKNGLSTSVEIKSKSST